ncbi:zinc finger MIZ domain-containing protein 2 [Rhypophila decipiens]|uniref:Zinc finger MIZ domain-containing protein 2 n=1 Tax=Rhypophila decipiens TaxID=261697 RepID=A0AAN6YJ89_9PEZI|nr:zinc finger MIZ domain-containing protein 2 [Rhypophila decipiens]
MPAQAIPGGNRTTSSGHDVASSNATANAFLGGRQPSWLSDGVPNSNARPRTSRQPIQNPNPNPNQTPTQHVLPSPAPSDEPSPALSNPLDSPNPPPPALTERQNMVSSGAPESLYAPVTEARFVPDLLLDEFSPIGEGPGSVLASPQISTLPSTLRPPIAPPHGQLLAAPQSGHNQSPIVAERRPSETGENGLRQAKRRRTDQNPFKYANFIPQIMDYIQRCGGEQALSHEVERPRLALLKDACEREDGFFLALHQLYMLWSNSPHWVYRIVQIEEQRTVDAAFAILETVLKKNQLMSTSHQEWFAKFPAEIKVLLETYAPYKNAVSQVSQFLKKLPDNFKPLSDKSVLRGYPYLVDELLLYLSCYSPVLQMIFFTASRRRLGIQDGPLGSRIEQAFRADQKNHPITEKGEIEKRNENTIRYYRAIVEHAPRPPSQLAQPAGSSSHSTTSAQRPLRPPSASATMPQSIPSSPSGELSYKYPSTLFHNLAGHSQPHFNSPLMANSPTGHPGTPAQMLQQLQSLQQPYQQVQQAVHQQLYPQQFITQGSLSAGLSPPLGRGHGMYQAPIHQQLPHLAPRQSPSLSSISIPQSGRGSPAAVVGSAISPGFRQMPPASTQAIRQNAASHRTPKVLNNRALMVPNYRIPTSDAPREPSEPKAILMSLHQAHVRSPKRVVNLENPESMEGFGPFYQAAIGPFPVGPTPIVANSRLQEFRFEVTSEQYQLTSRSFTKQGELLPTVEQFNGSLRWRVRCCKVRKDQPPTEGQWCASDTSWPPNIYIKFNGKPLSIRRRTHNGKDLATELTDEVQPGTNIVQVVLSDPKKQRPEPHFLAVEILQTLSHGHVMDMLMGQKSLHVDKEDTLNVIKSRINRPLDDDDIAFSVPSLSIDLADPFSAVIFKIPVRGSECTHLECFDLENFLTTRLPVKTANKCGHHYVRCGCPPVAEPSNPDKWRCPICGRDARPYALRIDGFLEDVRSELEEKGQLSARSIEVDGEGNWTVPVLDPDDEIGDSDDDDPPPNKKRAAPIPAKEKAIEVIELD